MTGNDALREGHAGISIYDPAKGKYLYAHNADKYFVPASNVKIVTSYAAMKHLGTRLKGLKYAEQENAVIIEATGDPTFLHPSFTHQPVFDYLRNKQHILINTENWKAESLGSGWSWDDYSEAYMTERSPMPFSGNVVRFRTVTPSAGDSAVAGNNLSVSPSFFRDSMYKSEEYGLPTDAFTIQRDKSRNNFRVAPADSLFSSKDIPYVTNGFETVRKLLRDTLKTDIRASYYTLQNPKIIFSHPTDSVLKIMMHASDNFLAEQMLLMVSNEQTGIMSDEVRAALLKTDLAGLPGQPRWADGSGLSRYNLFTPKDFVVILDKIKNEFGLERVKEIFPTGNEGTLKNYYGSEGGLIYAKTGSMSGVFCISGYLYTKKNRLLLFSVLINNFQSSPTDVRRSVEAFLKKVRQVY